MEWTEDAMVDLIRQYPDRTATSIANLGGEREANPQIRGLLARLAEAGRLIATVETWPGSGAIKKRTWKVA